MGDGSTLDVIDTGFGRLGGLICWENYMPLARAALYARGTDIYLAPTWHNSDVWVPTLQHIGKEGRTYVVGVTSCIRATDLPAELPGRPDLYGGAEDWLSRGNTAIIGPDGAVLAGPLTGEEGIIYAEISTAAARASRQQFDPAGHYSRSDVLHLSVDATARTAVSFSHPADAHERAKALTRPSAPRRSANHLEVPMDSASVKQTAGPEPAVRDGVLVNGSWLEAHQHDAAVRVV
jgi:nitrilase